VATPAATTTYYYKVTDASQGTPAGSQCSAADTVTVNPALAAGAITPAAPAIDSGQSITLTSNPSGGTTPYAYTWWTGAGCTAQIGGAAANTYVASPAATTTYYYKVTDASSGTPAASSCSAADTVTVNPALVAGAITPAAPTIDNGQSITLTSAPSGGTTPYVYTWWTGAGCTAQIGGAASNTYVASPAVTTTYYYKVTDASQGTPAGSQCSAGDVVTVNPTLVAGAITPAAPTIDSGQSVTLTSAPSGGTTPYAYTWWTGAGCTAQIVGAASNTYVATPGATTTYYYEITDNSVGTPAASACSAGDTVTVNPLPVPTMAVENITTSVATTNGYVGEVLKFVGSATLGTGAYSYSVIFGDGTTSPYQSNGTIDHHYSAVNTYAGTLDVKDAVGGIGSVGFSIQIYAVLTSVSLVATPPSGIIPLPVTLTSSTTGGITPSLAWSWQYGDGSVLGAGAASESHTYTHIENATVNLTITDSQGEKVVQHVHIFAFGPLVVTIIPTIPSGNLDPPLNVTYTETIHGGSYFYPTLAWNFGDGNTSSVASPPTETYWHSGNYKATLSVTDNASDVQVSTYSLTVTGSNATLSLGAGWNLITLPGIDTNYNMWFFWETLVLSGAAPATTTLTIQNNAGTGNYSFPGAGTAANANQAIGPARGIWVDVVSAVNVKLSGTLTAGPLAGITLKAGWNNIGWALTGSPTNTASELAAEIPGATAVSEWNVATQTYTTYIVGFSSSAYDFNIADGQGILVWVSAGTSITES
jgi:PKD repeat protein